MKPIFLCFIGLACWAASCDPPSDCTDPRCFNSPTSLRLKAHLSDTNRILRLGDTLTMSLTLPDTLVTNQGDFYLESLQLASVGLDYYRIDTLIDKTHSVVTREPFLIKKGHFAFSSTAVEFDAPSKKLELLFVLNKTGKFYFQIELQAARCEVTLKGGRKYLLMTNVGFNVIDSHHEMHLSWIPNPSDREEHRQLLQHYDDLGVGWYSFKVE